MIDYKKKIERELKKQRKYWKRYLDGELDYNDKVLGRILIDRIGLLEDLLEHSETSVSKKKPTSKKGNLKSPT